MAAKDWDQMKDKAQQMTLTIRTVDGQEFRTTGDWKDIAEIAVRVELRVGDIISFKSGKMYHSIERKSVVSWTTSEG